MVERSDKEDEEEDEDEEIMLGLTLGEIMLIGNGLASFSLSFMSLVSRSANLPYPPGKSFYSHTRTQFDQSPSSVSFLYDFLLQIFRDSAHTRGGMLVFESLLALFCAGMFIFMLEMSRKHNVQHIGNKTCLWAFALMPVCAQFLGVGTVFALSTAWLSKNQRKLRERNTNLDFGKTLVAVSTLGAFSALQYLMFSEGKLDETWLVWFLVLVPLVPALAFIIDKVPVNDESKPMQLVCGFLAIGGFLLVGTFGVTIHTRGFSQFENEMREDGGQKVVDLIVKDCLSNAPSRFVFAQFVHLCVSSITYSRMKMRHSDGQAGLGLILFMTSLVGPTGSFSLLAAHNEFRLLKQRKLL